MKRYVRSVAENVTKAVYWRHAQIIWRFCHGEWGGDCVHHRSDDISFLQFFLNATLWFVWDRNFRHRDETLRYWVVETFEPRRLAEIRVSNTSISNLVVVLAEEFSKLLLFLRWYLAFTDQRDTSLYFYNGLIMTACFFLCRIACMPIYWYQVFIAIIGDDFQRLVESDDQ